MRCMCQAWGTFNSLNPPSKDQVMLRRIIPTSRGGKRQLERKWLAQWVAGIQLPLLSLPHHLPHSSQQGNEKGDFRRTVQIVIIYWGAKFTPASASFPLPHPGVPGTPAHLRVEAQDDKVSPRASGQRARLLQGKKWFGRSFHPFPCAQAVVEWIHWK